MEISSTGIREKIISIIEKEKDDALENLALYNTIAKALSKFEGKCVTRRILAEVKKALPDTIVDYKHANGEFRLIVCEVDQSNHRRYARYFNLGYDTNPHFSIDKFMEVNRRDRHKEKIEALQMINIDELTALVYNFLSAKQSFANARERTGVEHVYYTIKDAFGI